MIKIAFIVAILSQGLFSKSEKFILISKNRSPNLERYEAFSDAAVMTFQVPENTVFASFKFVASEQDLSIFGCTTRNVSVYLKYGSPPLINPDGSPFPEEIRNVSTSEIYNIEFQTDSKDTYVNISSPDPGSFYAATFLAYQDPRYRKISQQGLTQSCNAFVDTSLYVMKVDNPTIVSENQLVDVISTLNQSRYFMFLAPDRMDHAILTAEKISFSTNLKQVIVRVQARKPPSDGSFLIRNVVNNSNPSVQALFAIEPLIWHYIEFEFQNESEVGVELNFNLKFFSNSLPTEEFVTQTFGNTTLYNMSVISKSYQSNKLTDIQPYTQYDLVRESTSESFSFSYKLPPEMDYNMLVPINVTSSEFSVLKLKIEKVSDIGGSLQYSLAFKPRITKKGKTLSFTNEPESNTVIGCIQKDSISLPTWPKYCSSNDISILSPIILNKTTGNATVLIPYPESGVWYASFKLFCGICEPCNCPVACQQEYETCTIECELNCTNALMDNCQNCVERCSSTIVGTEGCAACDCDGPCRKNSSDSCNSSVIFDVASRPCYFGSCGKQGKCALLISEGTAYSSCLCINNYRGFACTDGSQATPYSTVVLEFLLLVLSNIFFLPAAYVAFKRKYYVETLSYFSVFLSSTFYHSCDAGEKIISFCIFRLSALQFADFFSALLAIWLTLLAMADLRQVHLSLLQMAGSIVIAFCVTLNRYAFWIFALPSSVGIVTICISWYFKYKKFQGRFIDKNYLYVKLPVGSAIVIIGLLIYGLLQTTDNYKYLHSLWHIIIASGIFFLLPKKNTFQAVGLL